MSTSTDQPYLIVSGDSHAGPSLEHQLRPYCPQRYLDQFDDFVALAKTGATNRLQFTKKDRTPDGSLMSPEVRAAGLATLERIRANPGSMHADARLADMDADGIAAEVIFAGAQNNEVLPWAGGFDAGMSTIDGELRAVGGHIWNEWLAEYCAAAPERLLGVAQIPIWDVDAAIAEVHWAKEHGLRAINFPAPRPDYPAYNEYDVYGRFWSAVEEVGLPLVTHSASGEAGSGGRGDGAVMVFRAEILWLSRRGLGQLIFGRVFDRHPSLTMMFVEQRGHWVLETLRDFDSSYLSVPTSGALELLGATMTLPKKLPTDYWNENCILADSFMAPFEAAMRERIGLRTMMWGSDYPHLEGTWPRTRLALRHTFAGIREGDVRAILGENGARVFNLDRDVLQPVVDRIGIRPADISEPLAPDEFPPYRGLAFRQHGPYH